MKKKRKLLANGNFMPYWSEDYGTSSLYVNVALPIVSRLAGRYLTRQLICSDLPWLDFELIKSADYTLIYKWIIFYCFRALIFCFDQSTAHCNIISINLWELARYITFNKTSWMSSNRRVVASGSLIPASEWLTWSHENSVTVTWSSVLSRSPTIFSSYFQLAAGSVYSLQ